MEHKHKMHFQRQISAFWVVFFLENTMILMTSWGTQIGYCFSKKEVKAESFLLQTAVCSQVIVSLVAQRAKEALREVQGVVFRGSMLPPHLEIIITTLQKVHSSFL